MRAKSGDSGRKKTLKTTEREYETLAALRYALRQFLRFSEQAALDAGLTPQQHQALLAIKGFPNGGRLTVGGLAERLQIRHHSAVGLADRLCAKGLILRHPGRADRRQVYLALRARGLRVLDRLSAAHKEQLRRIGPRLESLLRRLRGL
jgi:DNA-binding MarR family transcriptional regulator